MKNILYIACLMSCLMIFCSESYAIKVKGETKSKQGCTIKYDLDVNVLTKSFTGTITCSGPPPCPNTTQTFGYVRTGNTGTITMNDKLKIVTNIEFRSNDRRNSDLTNILSEKDLLNTLIKMINTEIEKESRIKEKQDGKVKTNK